MIKLDSDPSCFSIKSRIAEVVLKSLSLYERLNKKEREDVSLSDKTLSFDNEYLVRWCQTAAKGNCEQFEKRLEWEGLSINSLRSDSSLVAVLSTGKTPMPDWVVTLQAIVSVASKWQSASSEEKLESSAIIDPTDPMPFEDLLLPVLQVAHKQLTARLGKQSSLLLDQLTAQTYRSLRRQFLCQLLNICEQTLDAEFTKSRPFGYRTLCLFGSSAKVRTGNTQYKKFVGQLLEDGLLSFFLKYPVLGRLISSQVVFWVEATAEFIEHLKVDREAILKTFKCSRSQSSTSLLGKVTGIESHLSDPHHEAKSVALVTFSSGLKLIYKPRSLDLEAAYSQLLNWFNQHNSPLPFRVLKVLSRKDYGWVEYAEHLPCQNEAAVRLHYQRSGMLLCLLYLLGCTDCHYENLVASGEHLLLIDTETLLNPEAEQLQFVAETEIPRVLYRKFWDSVLRTGLLPRWQLNGQTISDISGLGSAEQQTIPSQVIRWQFVNQDAMHRAYKLEKPPIQKNLVTIKGLPVSPNDYLDELLKGFDQFYQYLIQNKQRLLASKELAALRKQPIRFLFRDTLIYSSLIRKTLSPEYLKDGVKRSIELDILARAFLASQNKPDIWPILHQELNSLEKLDIPYFSACSGSTTLLLEHNDRGVAQYFETTSYSLVISRLHRLNKIDLNQQRKLVSEAFKARVAKPSQVRADLSPEILSDSLIHSSQSIDESNRSNRSLKQDSLTRVNSLDAISTKIRQPLDKAYLQSAAIKIAEDIESHAIYHTDGSAYWIELDYIDQAERFQLQPLGMNLYNGMCGIVLFLAAADYVNNTNQFEDLTLGAVQTIHQVLRSTSSKYRLNAIQHSGVGAIAGISSIIYSLVKINQFICCRPRRASPFKRQSEVSSRLIDDAMFIAQGITPKVIAADSCLDIMSGSAGAVLGLLALYKATKDPTILEKAAHCGQHLLRNRVAKESSYRAWKTFYDRPLTGFSHGAAGISYALLMLYQATKEVAYLEAAEEGIKYEQAFFLPNENNWPDFRYLAPSDCISKAMVSWCNGATGIGLARLGCLPELKTAGVEQDIEAALQVTQDFGLGAMDRLCCGNFGRIELLLLGSLRLDRPHMLELAKRQAAQAVDRAKKRERYSLTYNFCDTMFSPSFFIGTAGIGYELLRLNNPEKLPSILLLE